MLKILNNKSFKALIDNFSLVFFIGGGGGYCRKFKLCVYVMTYINKNVYK